jgi:hypothetical protein
MPSVVRIHSCPYFGLAGQQSSTRAKYALRSSAFSRAKEGFCFFCRPLASSAASYGKPYFGLAGQQSRTRAKYALRSSAAAERRRTFVPSRYTSWKFNFSRPWYVFNSSSGRTSECYCIFILTTCILGWLDHKDTKRNQDRQQ